MYYFLALASVPRAERTTDSTEMSRRVVLAHTDSTDVTDVSSTEDVFFNHGIHGRHGDYYVTGIQPELNLFSR